MRPLLYSLRLVPRSSVVPASSTAPSTFCLRLIHQSCPKRPSLQCHLQFYQRRPLRFRWFSSAGGPSEPSQSGTTRLSSPSATSKLPAPSIDPSDATTQGELGNLPSEQENRRSDVSKKFSASMDDFQTVLFNAGQKLNDVTGYSGIEALKKSIEKQEENVQKARLTVRDAKEAYQAAISRRSASQREVNELLQRKHAWDASDLERFTQLYRSDHANEQAEAAAQESLAQAERIADESQARLASTILARYHEEQIWSDKIRRASTWGTWGLMGFNVLLFIVVQLGLEPWKRRRLVGGFEEKVREVIQEENMRNAILHVRPEESSAVEAVERLINTPNLAEDAVAEKQSVQEQEEPSEEVSEDVVEDIAAATTGGDTVAAVAEQAMPNIDEVVPHFEEAAHQETVYGRLRGLLRNVQKQKEDLFSDRQVVIRQADLTTIALQSAGLGALMFAVVSFAITHR